MATSHPTAARPADHHLDSRSVLLLCAYVGFVVGTVAAATGAAVLLAGFTGGLGGFVLLGAGWLAVVCGAPAVARRGTGWVAGLELGQRAPRSTRAVAALVAVVRSR